MVRIVKITAAHEHQIVLIGKRTHLFFMPQKVGMTVDLGAVHKFGILREMPLLVAERVRLKHQHVVIVAYFIQFGLRLVV